MGDDDPSQPLLGRRNRRRQGRATRSVCSLQSWKRRLPITIWLPKYKLEWLIRDIIAGITVGLTSIPQGIAYAIIAGVPPQVGLYSSIFPGVVYMLFGSCKDVTVGPTAILAALLSKYVAKSVDFAYLAAFLSGCCILLLGVLQLGFLLDFISKPVISGFTAAAALQIAASQLRNLFRVSGASGDTFVSAMVNFFKNITTVHLWDTVLGVSCIVILVILKRSSISASDIDSACRLRLSAAWQYVVRARNAIVVCVAAAIAAILHSRGSVPFALTGKIEGGLPEFGWPPFSTRVGNSTLNFREMLEVFGPEGFVMPLVAILESIAIAKAFAGNSPVDGSQELVAIGMCNVVSSMAQSMPATGSFTRTALNHASGVITPAGSFFKVNTFSFAAVSVPYLFMCVAIACLVLLSVTLLADAFYFIPRAALGAVIVVAMAALVDLAIIKHLWRHSKGQLAVYVVTAGAGAGVGLEYGILAGALADVARLMIAAARPAMPTHLFKVGNQECVCVTMAGVVSHVAAERVARSLRESIPIDHIAVLDGKLLRHMDIGVAENLISVIRDMEGAGHRFLLWNFSEPLRVLFEDLQSGFETRFVNGPSIDQYILGNSNTY